MDNIASKDEIIIDDVNFKGGLTMSQKIEDVGKKKATIGQSPKLMNDDDLSKKKGKEAKTPLARIPRPPLIL